MRFSHLLFSCSIGFMVMLGACREEEVPPVTASGTREELTLDSIFLYARETYLWYDALPDYTTFNPRRYAADNPELQNLQAELLDITRYAINPSTGVPYEFVPSADIPKYSSLYEQNESISGRQASVSPEGIAYGFGFALTASDSNDVRVRYITPGSPAAAAGLERGFQVLAINGEEVSASSEASIQKINRAFLNPAITVAMRKPDQTIVEVTLNQRSYTADPVYKSMVLESGSKKVGYVFFGAFTSLSNSQAALDKAFASFSAAAVTDLVIDLRYNDGGYLETADYLMGLIAPSRLENAVLYTERYNDRLQNRDIPLLARQLLRDSDGNPVPYQGRYATYADVDYSEAANVYTIHKKGSLETVTNIVFIITEHTASASELVINALKPYVNVVLVGTPSYGKPVGFFGIMIDQYILYTPNFQLLNAAGEGDYYEGFRPHIAAEDDVTHDFGDPEEACLSAAWSYIQTGVIDDKAGRKVLRRNKELDNPDVFIGMIETRKIMRKK